MRKIARYVLTDRFSAADVLGILLAVKYLDPMPAIAVSFLLPLVFVAVRCRLRA